MFRRCLVIAALGILAASANADDAPGSPAPPRAEARARVVLPDGTVIEAIAVAEGDGSKARATATHTLARYRLGLFLTPVAGGMRVERIDSTGPATRMTRLGEPGSRYRLDPGDLITHLDGQPVTTHAQMRQAMVRVALNRGKVWLRVKDGSSGAVAFMLLQGDRVTGP